MYLDNAATTKVSDAVLKEMLPYMTTIYGNPSSKHTMGRQAKEAVETARSRVAKAINAEPNQIIFFSSATEVNNTLLQSFENKVAVGKYEHSSLSHTAKPDSCFDIMLDAEIMSFIWVQNETGDIFDIKQHCNQAHTLGKLFHTDATQAFGKVPINVKDIDIDFMTLSGHKCYAPKGVAALYCKDPTMIKPLLQGGRQEKGYRASTENVPAIVGMGKAFELYNYNKKIQDRLIDIKQFFIVALNQYDIKYHINTYQNIRPKGSSIGVIPNILNISFPGVNGEALQTLLNEKEIYVSTSSACSSGQLENKVLKAMGIPEDNIYSAIRISFSADEIQTEIDYLAYREKVFETASTIGETVEEMLKL